VISITKAEKIRIQSKFPNTHIVRTMRQDSKRHHYYMAEERGPMKMLRDIRNRELGRGCELSQAM